MTGRSLYVIAFSIAVMIVGIVTAFLFVLSPPGRERPDPRTVIAAPPPAADGSVLLPTTPAWTEVGSDPSELAWSPDGRLLAFAVPRAFGTVRLMVASVGTDGRAIADAVAPNGEVTGQRFRLMQRPSWHGAQLLFEGTLERSAVRRVYATTPGDATATPLVTEVAATGNVEDAMFDPAGERLVFVHAGLQSSDVELLDLRTRRTRKLDPAPGDESAPVFAPDGKSVIFARRIGGDTDLYRIDLTRGRVDPFAQGAGHQDHATPLTGPPKAAMQWLMISSSDGRTGDLVLLADNSPRVIESGVRVPEGPLSLTPDRSWVASLPADRDDAVVLSNPSTEARVVVRTGTHGIAHPALGVLEGRVRLAYVAGDTGNRSVYITDVTDLLASPQSSATAPGASAAAPAAPLAPAALSRQE